MLGITECDRSKMLAPGGLKGWQRAKLQPRSKLRLELATAVGRYSRTRLGVELNTPSLPQIHRSNAGCLCLPKQ